MGVKLRRRISNRVGPILRTPSPQKLTRLRDEPLSTTSRNSPIGSALVQQCATEIYLPNPRADEDEYVKGFKVTKAEFDLIKNLGEDSRHFLVKQGHRSALVRFNLEDVKDDDGNTVISFSDELSVLSGSSDNIELLDQVLEEVGEVPADWLPVFHERRKARKSIKK